MSAFVGVIKWFAGLLLISVTLQTIFFIAVLRSDGSPRPSQAIIIFRGSEPRIAVGYGLASQHMAPLIVLSPASETERLYYDRRYKLPPQVTHLPEPYAHTTLANAWYAAGLIRRHDLNEVILVTANYHMPRSLALMRLFLIGHRVTIHPYKVTPPTDGPMPDNYPIVLTKLIYNETLKFWGSLAELAAWHLVGGGLGENHDSTKWQVAWLRNLLLLQVNEVW